MRARRDSWLFLISTPDVIDVLAEAFTRIGYVTHSESSMQAGTLHTGRFGTNLSIASSALMVSCWVINITISTLGKQNVWLQRDEYVVCPKRMSVS